MRVGFVSYSLDTGLTGLGRYMIQLMRSLAALPSEIQVVLLATEKRDQYGLWREFETCRLPLCRRAPTLMSWGNIAVAAAARRRDLDIVHDPNGIAPFFSARGATRRVVTVHDAFSYVQPDTHTLFDNWRCRVMLPRALRRADMVLTDSHASRRDIHHYLKVSDQRLRVVPCGVDRHFAPVPDGPARQRVLAGHGITGPYLLYVGAINARKNIARLYEAFWQVRQQRPDVTLVVVGKRQWHTGEIDATFSRLCLDDAVIFTGYVADDELPSLYSGAAVFVFPSLYEGFGLPPLEAMACGAPVITSNVSSLPEVVGDAALTVEPTDTRALATAITRVLHDREERDALRRRGLARAAQFTWERAARETLDAYQAALIRPPSGLDQDRPYAG